MTQDSTRVTPKAPVTPAATPTAPPAAFSASASPVETTNSDAATPATPPTKPPAEVPAKPAPPPATVAQTALAKTPDAPPKKAPAVAGPAKMRRRHWLLGFSFALLVIAPVVLAAFYLWSIAKDQYASTTGFTVRQAETSAPVDLLGGLSQLSGSASGDADVLYEFILSQELVARIDAELDLRSMYSKAWPEDPVFAYNPDGSIEDLLKYWERMVRLAYDSGTGLMELRVLAFDPFDAQNIAKEIVQQSTTMINELSAIAREDATRYALEELDQSVERLKAAREAVTAFRSRNEIVDPNADIQVQMGLLNTLNQQLADALISFDLLSETTRTDDPRVTQAARRIEVIEERIADERKKFGVGNAGDGSNDYATLVAEFERLAVDREFAEQAYTVALSTFDAARAEAQRQSRYLATYIRPTLAETSRYPDRLLLAGLLTLFLILAWSIMALVYYSIRDRR